MSTGKIVQVIGAVVDVEFPRDAIPAIYDALKLDGTELTLEVQRIGAVAPCRWQLEQK